MIELLIGVDSISNWLAVTGICARRQDRMLLATCLDGVAQRIPLDLWTFRLPVMTRDICRARRFVVLETGVS